MAFLLVCFLTVAKLVAAQQPSLHPGQCPQLPNNGPCLELCRDDGACAREEKCCTTQCGGRVCVRSIINQRGPQGQGRGQRPPQQQFGNGQIGQANLGLNTRFQPQQQFLTPQQQQLQLQLAGQPSLVNIGGCSRGVSLRNSDGSTLVCGFGPRDFECPPSFSCTFDTSLKALVCCPSENATRPVVQADDDSNPCPEGEPIRDASGVRLQCNFAGGPANACPSGTICVVGACCPLSVAGLKAMKPGTCPLPLPIQSQNCQNECSFDAECPGAAKCCFVGCGARCVVSSPDVGAPASGNGQPGINGVGNAGVGGPLSGNGASISQFQPLQPNNGFQQQQQQRPQQGFNQQQNFLGAQNGQFPNNGPPGTFVRGPPRGPPGGPQQRPIGNGAPQFSPINNNQQFSRQFDEATD